MTEEFASISADLKAEAHVVHSSIDAEHQHIDELEDSIDKRIKAIEETVRNGRTSLADLELAMEEQEIQLKEDISDKTRSFERLLEKALKSEVGELEKRMDDRAKLLKENMTLVGKDEKESNGSRFEMELVRQERSQREALDNLKKNINTVLLQLLNQTGIGKGICLQKFGQVFICNSFLMFSSLSGNPDHIKSWQDSGSSSNMSGQVSAAYD